MNDVKLSDSDKNANIRMEKRDGETYIALGLFILAVSLPVILGTYWAYLPSTTVSIAVSRGQAPPVPDVAGQSMKQAEATLEHAGLVLGDVTEAFSAAVPAGSVVSQDPAAGAGGEPETKVNLTISKGPEAPVVAKQAQGPAFPVKVPGVAKQTQALAQQRLEYERLKVGAVSEEFNVMIPAETVISQDPAAGTSVLSGSAVNLVVSKGPATTIAPSVVQQTVSQAEKIIKDAGLLLGPVTESFSAITPAGSVVSQNPPAGDSINMGAAVQLVVSKGKREPSIASVPAVIGQPEAQAIKALVDAGLKLAPVMRSSSSTVAAGIVISQNPDAGSYLEHHFRAATVNIVCAVVLFLIGVAAIAYGRVLLARNKRRA